MSATVKIVGDTQDAQDAVAAVGEKAKAAEAPLKQLGAASQTASEGIKAIGPAARESATYVGKMQADMRRVALEAVSVNAGLQLARAGVQALANATRTYVASSEEAQRQTEGFTAAQERATLSIGRAVVEFGEATGVTALLTAGMNGLSNALDTVFNPNTEDRILRMAEGLDAVAIGLTRVQDLSAGALTAELAALDAQIETRAAALGEIENAAMAGLEQYRGTPYYDQRLRQLVTESEGQRELTAMIERRAAVEAEITANRLRENETSTLGLPGRAPFAGGAVNINQESGEAGGRGGSAAREVQQVSDAVSVLAEIQAFGTRIAEQYAKALRNVRDANTEGAIASKEASLAERESLALKQEAAAEEAKRASEASFLESQRRQADEAAESLERYRAVQGKIADATASAASSLVDTNEKASKAIIRATGKTLGAEGVSAIRRGVIMGFSGNPIGGALLAGAGGVAILAARGMGASVADSGSRGGGSTREITNNNVSQTIVVGRGASQADVLAVARATEEAARRGISGQRRAA